MDLCNLTHLGMGSATVAMMMKMGKSNENVAVLGGGKGERGQSLVFTLQFHTISSCGTQRSRLIMSVSRGLHGPFFLGFYTTAASFSKIFP